MDRLQLVYGINVLAGLLVLASYAGMTLATLRDEALGVPLPIASVYLAYDLGWAFENARFLAYGGPFLGLMVIFLLWPVGSGSVFVSTITVARRRLAAAANPLPLLLEACVPLWAAAAIVWATILDSPPVAGMKTLAYIVAAAVSVGFALDLLRTRDPGGKRIHVALIRAAYMGAFMVADLIREISAFPVLATTVCGLSDLLYIRLLLAARRARSDAGKLDDPRSLRP